MINFNNKVEASLIGCVKISFVFEIATFLTFHVLQKEKELPELSSQQSYVICNPLQNSSKTSKFPMNLVYNSQIKISDK